MHTLVRDTATAVCRQSEVKCRFELPVLESVGILHYNGVVQGSVSFLIEKSIVTFRNEQGNGNQTNSGEM